MRPLREAGRQLMVLALVACGERAATLEPIALAGDYARGRELVETYECGQCHLDNLRGTCVGCHREVVQGAEIDDLVRIAGSWRTPAQLDEWRENLVNMPAAPSLHAVGKLFRRPWIERFLRDPHDLRPRLGATMPRLDIDERDAHDIAAYLSEAESEEPYFADVGIADWTEPHTPLPAGDREVGLALYERLGCASCHAFTGAQPDPEWTVDGQDARSLLLAPDLRFTRERFQRDKVVPWLLEPTHHKVDATMPDFELDYQDARDLASYVMTEPLSDPAPRALPARLPPLERRVRYDEVYQKVFSKNCVHCHGEPEFALDDGGPGFSGGFGFDAVELSFASYEATLAGYITPEGKRRSVFSRDADGTPHIVAVLLARQRDEAGGMPLGFPALSASHIQLVESWVAQGRPR